MKNALDYEPKHLKLLAIQIEKKIKHKSTKQEKGLMTKIKGVFK